MNPRVLKTFEERLTGRDGRNYEARIVGRQVPEGHWEAWVEFVAPGSAPPLRSGRETTQSDLRNLERWAWALSRVYLEGSLDRTLRQQEPQPDDLGPPEPVAAPIFEAPAPVVRAGERPAPDDVAMNPIVHFHKGEADLRRKAAELPPSELRAIALAYRLDEGVVDLDRLGREELVEIIVAGVRARGSR